MLVESTLRLVRGASVSPHRIDTWLAARCVNESGMVIQSAVVVAVYGVRVLVDIVDVAMCIVNIANSVIVMERHLVPFGVAAVTAVEDGVGAPIHMTPFPAVKGSVLGNWYFVP